MMQNVQRWSQPCWISIYALDLPSNFTAFVHLTLVPYINVSGELKTKPTQHSVKELRSLGISPDCLICRSEQELPRDERKKIALFCSVDPSNVISMHDVSTVYSIPLLLHKQKVDQIIIDKLKIKSQKPKLNDWKRVVSAKINPSHEVNIAFVGKYTELKDSYKSLNEALEHAGIKNKTKVNIVFVEAENINASNAKKVLSFSDAILVPGGFGERGVVGKIKSIKFARENNIPFLGICLGMQCAIIDFARHVCGLSGANSTEFNKRTKYPVVDLMESQKAIKIKGGTMRLGAYNCSIKTGTKTFAAYRSKKISERHRHRYEVNNRYKKRLEKEGMVISGINDDLGVVETIEISDHPWFVAGQFHPELKSRVNKAHPLFRDFIKASKKYNKKRS